MPRKLIYCILLIIIYAIKEIYQSETNIDLIDDTFTRAEGQHGGHEARKDTADISDPDAEHIRSAVHGYVFVRTSSDGH